jgi:hypothetical protein
MHFLIMFNSDMATCYVILVLGWVQGIFIWDFVCVILLVVGTGGLDDQWCGIYVGYFFSDCFYFVYVFALFYCQHATYIDCVSTPIPPIEQWRPWKVLYKVSSKQNERWATQDQPTEPAEPLVQLFQYSVYIIYM